MLMNSPQLNQPINAAGRDRLLGRLLTATADNEQVATELYLHCLAREPSGAELKICLEHVQLTGDQSSVRGPALVVGEFGEIRYRN